MLTAQSSRMMKDSVKRACKPKDKRFRDASVKCTVYINNAQSERHLTEKRRDMPAKLSLLNRIIRRLKRQRTTKE